jgi:hypothetical protein
MRPAPSFHIPLVSERVSYFSVLTLGGLSGTSPSSSKVTEGSHRDSDLIALGVLWPDDVTWVVMVVCAVIHKLRRLSGVPRRGA